jgi:hypothetical protein
VAELADAHGSGPCGSNIVEVRVLSTASSNRLMQLLLGSCISLFFISGESDGGPILTVTMLRSIIWRRYRTVLSACFSGVTDRIALIGLQLRIKGVHLGE